MTDLDRWLSKLRAEGVRILEEPYEFGNSRAFLIEGPSREALELVEVLPDVVHQVSHSRLPPIDRTELDPAGPAVRRFARDRVSERDHRGGSTVSTPGRASS